MYALWDVWMQRNPFFESWVSNLANARHVPVTQNVHVARADEKTFTVGDFATIERTFSRLDFVRFALLSGDWNPLHWNRYYADGTPFKGVLAHGFFVGSLMSTLFGVHFPGEGAVYCDQTMKFRGPVRPGDTVRACAKLKAFNHKGHAIFECEWRVKDKVVISGEAELVLPRV